VTRKLAVHLASVEWLERVSGALGVHPEAVVLDRDLDHRPGVTGLDRDPQRPGVGAELDRVAYEVAQDLGEDLLGTGHPTAAQLGREVDPLQFRSHLLDQPLDDQGGRGMPRRRTPRNRQGQHVVHHARHALD
jgi:hypothetical protein